MGQLWKELSVADRRTMTVVGNVTRTQIVHYAGASGDFNSWHTDEVYAKTAAGYPTVSAHGMLIMGNDRTASDRLAWRRLLDEVRCALPPLGLAGRRAGRHGHRGRHPGRERHELRRRQRRHHQAGRRGGGQGLRRRPARRLRRDP